MQKNNQKEQGITHLVLLVTIVGALVVGGTYITVRKANHKSTQDNSKLTTKVSSTPKLNSQPAASTSTLNSRTSSSSTNPTSSTSSSPPVKNSVPSSSGSTSSSSPNNQPANSAPAPTPLSTLISLIDGLHSGNQLYVTTNTVSVPGPVTTATAKPIVFTLNGQTYFAYTQTYKPNFNTSSSDTANTMAIVNATVSNPPLQYAHLDKSNNLVDENIQAVGYSTGGS